MTTRKLSPIAAEHPNHFWGSDITVITLGRNFHLAAIIDLFSRDILAWDLFTTPPHSANIMALFERAAASLGRPKNFLSDQGKQYKGDLLKDALEQLGIDHREGAVGQHGSIAIVERLWRSLKGHLDLTTVRPSVPDMLRERVTVVVDYYRTKRPHIALGNATPEQIYTGRPAPASTATKAPRGWRGDACAKVPFVIRYAFDLEKKLPYLERVA